MFGHSKQGQNYEEKRFDTIGFIGAEKTLTPYNMWKGFRRTKIQPLNFNAMHPLKNFNNVQEPTSIEIAIDDL